MKTELQQKLREILNKYNPELMELSFGCEVVVLHGESIQERDAIVLETGEHVIDSFPGGGDHKQDYVPYEIVWLKDPYTDCPQLLSSDTDMSWVISRIIGHPIELRHLLIALGDKLSGIQPTKEKGWFCIWDRKANNIYINLSIPLLDNEEEVLQGLIDLLS